jgi:hypothetical protein
MIGGDRPDHYCCLFVLDYQVKSPGECAGAFCKTHSRMKVFCGA